MPYQPRCQPTTLCPAFQVIAGLIIAVCVCSTADAWGDQDSRPNVLVVLVDDMGYSDPGFMGGEVATPNLDRLAANGLRFTQCYNSARCCPSRASLVTGLYPHQTGIGSFATAKPNARRGPAYLGRLNDQCVTFAEVLGDAGYQTYMVGKWHMEMPGPIARGFDEFYGYVRGYEQNQWEPDRYVRLPEGRSKELQYPPGEFYATDAFTDYTLEFLKQARSEPNAGRPWLIYLAHSSPHFPVQAPKKTVDRFLNTYRRGWDILRKQRFERMKSNGLAQDSWKLTERSLVPVDRDDIANGYSGRQNPAWAELPADRREDLARRGAIAAAMTHHVDQGLGKIVKDLQKHGELDNTLILFLSDNGACYEWGPFGFDGPSRQGKTKLHRGPELESMGGPGSYHAYGSGWANLGNTPFRLYKHFCHEGGNCTPMVAHWPQGITKPDRWIREPIHLIDVMPTLCSISQAKYPAQRSQHRITPTEGVSLTPIFAGADQLAPRSLFSEHQEARSVRRGKWKAVWSKRMPNDIQWELYDLEADRCETSDLARQHPEVVSELDREWKQWAARVKVFPFFEGANRLSPTATGGNAIPRGGKIPKRQPTISERSLEVTATVNLNSDQASGVILAQGGRTHGYSLHVDKGKLVFSVRRNGTVTATKPVPLDRGQIDLTARLTSTGHMHLRVGNREVAQADAGGLIPGQPQDRLTIGFDDQTAVGDYTAPFALEGKVLEFQVKAEHR